MRSEKNSKISKHFIFLKEPARAGLLSGIEGFSKGKLKKTVTKDCSAPVTCKQKRFIF